MKKHIGRDKKNTNNVVYLLICLFHTVRADNR